MNPALKRFVKMQLLALLGAFLLSFLTASVFSSLNSTAQTSSTLVDYGGYAIGAGLAIGLAGLGAGVGMGTASSAIVGAISEKPEMFGRSFIFVILIEAIAIYGLVISFILIGKMP